MVLLNSNSNLFLSQSIFLGQDYFLDLFQDSESGFMVSGFVNNFYCYSLSSSEFVIYSRFLNLSKPKNFKQILKKEGFFQVFSFPFFCNGTISDHRFYHSTLVFLRPAVFPTNFSNCSQEFSFNFSEYAVFMLENWILKNEQAISYCKEGKKFKYKAFTILLIEWSQLYNQTKHISYKCDQSEFLWRKMKIFYFSALKKQLKSWFLLRKKFVKPFQKKLICSIVRWFCDKLAYTFFTDFSVKNHKKKKKKKEKRYKKSKFVSFLIKERVNPKKSLE